MDFTSPVVRVSICPGYFKKQIVQPPPVNPSRTKRAQVAMVSPQNFYRQHELPLTMSSNTNCPTSGLAERS
uniref:Uncharacterized protein n=1 Tax=Megaselia scalaris TaxID=36166 RepID=T1GEA7_MEGSC